MTDQAPAAADKPRPFTPAENLAYAQAVAKKQLKLTDEAAAAKVKELGNDSTAALVKAGRAGDLAKVRELLGVAD